RPAKRRNWRKAEVKHFRIAPLRQPIGIGGGGRISREKLQLLRVGRAIWRSGVRPLPARIGCIALASFTFYIHGPGPPQGWHLWQGWSSTLPLCQIMRGVGKVL